MSKRQLTPRRRFIRYLEQMLDWQRLPRDSEERLKAVSAWLEQGQHRGGKPTVAESATKQGQRIKRKRTGWKFAWRDRIRADAALMKMANKAGVLDKPRPDAQPGDFANPDPRIYKFLTRGPPPSPAAERETLPPQISRAAWAFFKRK
jgi:hypothetical protein